MPARNANRSHKGGAVFEASGLPFLKGPHFARIPCKIGGGRGLDSSGFGHRQLGRVSRSFLRRRIRTLTHVDKTIDRGAPSGFLHSRGTIEEFRRHVDRPSRNRRRAVSQALLVGQLSTLAQHARPQRFHTRTNSGWIVPCCRSGQSGRRSMTCK